MRMKLTTFLIIIFLCYAKQVISTPLVNNYRIVDTLPQNDSFTCCFDDFSCHIDYLPAITFINKSSVLSKRIKDTLNMVSEQLQLNPDCRIILVGVYANDNKITSLNFERMSTIMRYLVEEQGIYEGRIMFRYSKSADPDRFDIEAF